MTLSGDNVRELKALVTSAAVLSDPAGDGSISADDLTFARSGEPTTSLPGQPAGTLAEAVAELERRMITGTLIELANNHSAAVRRLGLSLAKLLKMMSRLGLRSSH